MSASSARSAPLTSTFFCRTADARTYSCCQGCTADLGMGCPLLLVVNYTTHKKCTLKIHWLGCYALLVLPHRLKAVILENKV